MEHDDKAAAALDRIEEALQAHPELADRTARWLAGELEEGPVHNEKQTAIRLPEELLDRAAALEGPMQRDPRYMGLRMTRSAVLRLALQRGLEALEAEYTAGGAR